MEFCVILAGFLRANGHTFSPYFCLSLKVSQKWRNTFFVLNYNMNSPNVQGPLFFLSSLFYMSFKFGNAKSFEDV